MKELNIFGKGFIGGRFCEMTDNVIINEREDYLSKTNDILYMISTIDNSNVHTDPFLDIDTNLNILIKVLESCKHRKVVTFNFISSWFVYGNTDLPAREDSRCYPNGFYSITKRTAEQLLISYCETFDIKYRIIRMANVLGEQDKKVSAKKNALQYLIRKIKNDEDIFLYDNGNICRDYIYVDDAVTAINMVIDKGKTNEIYNVGNGEPVEMRSALAYVRLKTCSKSKFINIEPSDLQGSIQTKNMVLNVNKIKDLGYEKKYKIYDILDILIEKG